MRIATSILIAALSACPTGIGAKAVNDSDIGRLIEQQLVPVLLDEDGIGGVDNASAYVGMVPDQRLGVVILVNRGSRNPHEVARNIILPELARF
jgi:hypothetical protein